MNLMKILQDAVNYMEMNIKVPITYKEVADTVFMSPFHFHRTFSMITGLSVKEYLRNRRLSLAGEEIVLTQRKVIDIALDYCYQSPESFTKAFSRFHGITPSEARKAGGGLKMFNPLTIKITTEGGKPMDYRIEKREPFNVLTKSKLFNGDTVNEEGNTEIPDFWKESGKNDTFKVLTVAAKNQALYGMCSPIDKDSNNFNYGIGKEVESYVRAPEGFEIWEIDHPLWAVFKCIGSTPSCIGDTWSRIFNEFLPGSDYEFVEATDFEFYPEEAEDNLFCEIWIPIGKK